MPGFALLYATMFIMAAGNLAMMSLFPAIARSSGIPDLAMVTVQSVSAGLSILAMPYWAARSDRVGRRPVVLIGIAGFTTASALTAAAIFTAVHGMVSVMVGIAALVVSRAVFGAIGLAAAPAIQAFVADETAPAQRTGSLASMYSAQGFGSIVGPAIAPLLILSWAGLAGPQIAFTLIGCVILISAAIRLPRKPVLTQRADDRGSGNWDTLRRRTVLPFVAYLAVLSGCQMASLQMLGFVVMDRLGLEPVESQPLASVAMMLGAAAAVIVQLGIIRRTRARATLLMVIGSALMVAGNVLMAIAPSYILVVIAYVLSSAGAAFGIPAAASGASLANSRERQGAVAGLISAASSSGLLIAPVFAMIVYRSSPVAAFLAIAAMSAVALIIFLPRASRCLDGAIAEHEGHL